MLRLNNASRFNLADIAVQRLVRHSPNHPINVKAHELCSYWQHTLVQHEKYTIEHGEDPDWCGSIPEVKA